MNFREWSVGERLYPPLASAPGKQNDPLSTSGAADSSLDRIYLARASTFSWWNLAEFH